MRVIITGIQAAGKGTQSKLISDKYGLRHISTGDILREHINNGSDLVNGYTKEDMHAGLLAPIEVINNVMKYELTNSDNYILDGFPRSKEQLKLMESCIGEDQEINLVLFLSISDEEAIHRMTLRGRDDDNEIGIKKRINEYYQETYPIIYDEFVHYPNFHVIDGNSSPNTVFEQIQEAFNKIQ